MRIEDLMSRPVHTCFADDTLAAVVHEMIACDTGCLVVIDAQRRPVGIITDRDIATAAYRQGEPLQNLRANLAMSTELITAFPGTTVEELEAQMQAAQVRRVPVVDTTGMLVGIVSLSDLAQSAELSPVPMSDLPGVALTLAKIARRRDRPF